MLMDMTCRLTALTDEHSEKLGEVLAKAQHLEEHIKALEEKRTVSEEEKNLFVKEAEEQNAKVEKLEGALVAKDRELEMQIQRTEEVTNEMKVRISCTTS